MPKDFASGNVIHDPFPKEIVLLSETCKTQRV